MAKKLETEIAGGTMAGWSAQCRRLGWQRHCCGCLSGALVGTRGVGSLMWLHGFGAPAQAETQHPTCPPGS